MSQWDRIDSEMTPMRADVKALQEDSVAVLQTDVFTAIRSRLGANQAYSKTPVRFPSARETGPMSATAMATRGFVDNLPGFFLYRWRDQRATRYPNCSTQHGELFREPCFKDSDSGGHNSHSGLIGRKVRTGRYCIRRIGVFDLDDQWSGHGIRRSRSSSCVLGTVGSRRSVDGFAPRRIRTPIARTAAFSYACGRTRRR